MFSSNRLETNEIFRLLNGINTRTQIIMATITDIQNAIATQTTVEAGVVTLLQNLTAEIQAAQASGNPGAMDAVVASIQANTKTLSDAVAANTPVSPAAATTASTTAAPASTSK
jgi:hypothetical protein